MVALQKGPIMHVSPPWKPWKTTIIIIMWTYRFSIVSGHTCRYNQWQRIVMVSRVSCVFYQGFFVCFRIISIAKMDRWPEINQWYNSIWWQMSPGAAPREGGGGREVEVSHVRWWYSNTLYPIVIILPPFSWREKCVGALPPPPMNFFLLPEMAHDPGIIFAAPRQVPWRSPWMSLLSTEI